jgi:hypothetical protein
MLRPCGQESGSNSPALGRRPAARDFEKRAAFGTGACAGGDSPTNCQFGNLGRNSLRGPDFVWSDLYVTKQFRLGERLSLRVDGQFFNLLNHPNFGLPTAIAGIPGKPETQVGFGALTYTTSPPTG